VPALARAPHAPWAPAQFDTSVFGAIAGLAQTRLTVLSEITGYVDWLFLEQPPEDETSWAKAMKPGAAGFLVSVRKNWANADWTAEALRSGLEAAATEHGLTLGKAQAPVRVARATGRFAPENPGPAPATRSCKPQITR